MKHLGVRVLSNETIAENMRELLFAWPSGAPAPVPGQFVTIRSGTGTDPLLRRPFAFSSHTAAPEPDADGTAGIIFQKRGKATEMLASVDPGETLDMIGPLGNFFPSPPPEALPILIAGGIGIGPILALAQRLSRETLLGRRALPPVLVIGARSASGLPRGASLLRNEVRDIELVLCTDDGSTGLQGTAVDGLHTVLARDAEGSVLYCCGPTPMLRAVSGEALRMGMPAWVSLEQTMGCAVGACMGCVIRVNDEKKFARVCTDGPVFDAAYVDWEHT